MSIRQRVSDKAPKFKGQKSAHPIESYGIDSAEQIKNLYLHHGQLIKSNGCTVFGEASPSKAGGIISLHQFKDILIAQREDTLSFSWLSEYPGTIDPTAAPGNFTDIQTMTTSKRLFSAFWRDRLFLTNTRDVIYIRYGDSAGISLTSNVTPIGLDPPSAGLTAGWISSGGAGNVANGDYYYMIALYDSVTNTESPCGGACAATDGIFELSPNGFLGPKPALFTVSGGAKKVVISGSSLRTYLSTANAAVGYRATHFIIYRGTKTAGLYDSFYRVPQKDGGTYDGNVLLPITLFDFPGDFVDNTATLAAVSPPENNSPPPTPARMLAALTRARSDYNASENWTLANYSGFRHMRFFRDQLFGVGAHSYGFTASTEIVLSTDTSQKITGLVTQFRDLLHGSEVYQPDYWPYRWEVGKGDSQEAIGLGVLGDVALLIFKEGSTYYLSGSSPDNFVVRIMDTQKGCVHQGTIQETPKGVITLDRGGFVLWNKIGQGEKISDDIHDLIEQIQFQYAATFYSCYDTKLGHYRCSVASTGAPTVNGIVVPNFTFVLDLDTMEWSTEQGGEGLARLQLFLNSNNITSIIAEINGASSGIDVGRKYDLVGANSTGRVLDFSSEDSVDIQGTPIEAIWTSGTINFNDDQHKKRMKWIYLRAKSVSGWKINVEVIPDYDESRKFVLEDWDVLSSQSLWYSSDVATDGSLLWDDGKWASDGLTRQVSKIPVNCIGYTFQIRITNREADADRSRFTIESISAEGVMLGR